MAWFMPLLAAGASYLAGKGSKKQEQQAYDPVGTKTIYDPAQQAVANPLSAYLASEVGKGLPRYSGEIAPEIDPNLTNRYNEFLGADANTWFDKYVGGPSTKAFMEDSLPVIREGYAGSLRGSGRFMSEEQSLNKFSNDLAGLRYTANMELPKAQMAMAKDYYNMRDVKIQREYADWFQSLPENNPILQRAIEFLGKATGMNTLSYLNPGQESASTGLLNAGTTAISALASSGQLGDVLQSILGMFS